MEYVKGNLIDLFKEGNFDMIAHQCNCMGVMGAGIAGAIAKEFPKIKSYVNDYQMGASIFATAEVFGTEYGLIANLYSQFEPGRCEQKGIDSREVRLGALANCLRNINENFKGDTIGIPLIASGIAKDSMTGITDDLEYFKTYVAPIVEQCLKDMKVTVVYL